MLQKTWRLVADWWIITIWPLGYLAIKILGATYPVCIWFGGVLILWAGLNAWAKKIIVAEGPAGGQGNEAKRPLSNALVLSLADTTASIAIGLAIVAVVQLVLQFYVTGLSPEAVWDAEVNLSKFQLSLDSYFDIRFYTKAFASLLFLAVLLPNTRPISKFITAKKFFERFFLVISVMTWFTFFAFEALQANQNDWIAQRADRFKAAVEGIKDKERRLCAIATVQEDIRSLPNGARRQLKTFFSSLTAANPPSDYLDEQMREAKSAIPLANSPDPSTQEEARVIWRNGISPEDADQREAAFHRASAWIDNHDEGGSPLSLYELDLCLKEDERLGPIVGQAQKAAIEELSTAVDVLIPRGLSGISVEFAKTVVETAVGFAATHTFPRVLNFISTHLTAYEPPPPRNFSRRPIGGEVRRWETRTEQLPIWKPDPILALPHYTPFVEPRYEYHPVEVDPVVVP